MVVDRNGFTISWLRKQNRKNGVVLGMVIQRMMKLKKPINFWFDSNKLSKIPLEKRCIFQIPGMMDYLVHKSIAEPLIALNASGLHLVPVLEWDLSFGMTI